MADAHRAAFRPSNSVELELFKTFTIAAWVRRQCVIAETGMTNQYIRQNLLDEERVSAEAAECVRRLAFDPRKEADKVRRYEDAAIRRMSRACADFVKLRESGIPDEGTDAVEPAGIDFPRSSRRGHALWQGLTTLPRGRPEVSFCNSTGRRAVKQTAGSRDPREPSSAALQAKPVATRCPRW